VATPRKPKAQRSLRSRVLSPLRGRPRSGDAAKAITLRVREIRERVGEAGPDASRVFKLTSRRFADAIGITEKALNLRLRRHNPTPFSADELARICRVFCVRSDYLLLGEGPMLHSDVVYEEGAAPRRLSDILHEHLVGVASQADPDQEWVRSFLPHRDELLLSIEAAVVDSIGAAVEALVRDRRLANESVRIAVADQLRTRLPLPESPSDFFKEATTAALNGTVVGPRPNPSQISRRG
jgi:hypothetical protein